MGQCTGSWKVTSVSPMRRLFLFLCSFLLLVSFAARAAAPICKEYQFGDAGWFKTVIQACDAWASKTQAVQGANSSYNFRNWAHAVDGDGESARCNMSWEYSSKAPGSEWSTTGMGAGVVQTRTVECEEVCTSGKQGVVNLTTGYKATPTTSVLGTYAKGPDPFVLGLVKNKGAVMCYRGCKVQMPDPETSTHDSEGHPLLVWTSQVAGPNGLYRESTEFNYVETSVQCSEAPPDATSPSATPPVCPGSTTTVKGATVCLPSNSEPGLGEAGSGKGEANRGNPTAGPTDMSKSPSERAKGPGGDGNGTNGSNGGGSAGGPATGNNNGSTGKGCNDGSKSPTPACSGKGTNDQDGTVTKPATGKEQAACGAPGQPKCGIDETGTPEKVGDDKYNSKLDQYKTDSKNAGDQIKGEGDGVFSSYTTFFAAPALQACEPVELPAVAGVSLGSISKQCDVVEGVRSVMAYIWALVAMWVCLGWVKRATN